MELTVGSLFSGIGGIDLAFQQAGFKVTWAIEKDAACCRTYRHNFKDIPLIEQDIRSVNPNNLESVDVITAGFPCQPFSIAGVSKKNSLGRETGFKDKTQGTLFFDVADIISRHRPKAFFLENVKNLTSHDKGNTFRVIRETLEELDYSIYYQVMDGKTYVPQHRERIMIVGFDRKRFHNAEKFTFPEQHEPYPDHRNSRS